MGSRSIRPRDIVACPSNFISSRIDESISGDEHVCYVHVSTNVYIYAQRWDFVAFFGFSWNDWIAFVSAEIGEFFSVSNCYGVI